MPAPPPESSRSATSENPLIGAAFMLAGAAVFSISDAVTKHLVAIYPVGEIMLIRASFALATITPLLIARMGARAVFAVKDVRGMVLLMLFAAGETFAFIWVLQHMPLADATAIYFAAPLVVTLLAIPLLGEKVGWHRMGAALVGFMGVILIVRPEGGGMIGTAPLVAVLSMVLYSLILITLRRVSATETETRILVYVLITFTTVGGALSVFDWVIPTPADAALMAAMGLVTSLGIFLVNRAFTLAPASVVAPLDYSYLVWATLYGYLFWGELPAAPVWWGIGLIVAMGLYILHREEKTRRRIIPPHGGTHP